MNKSHRIIISLVLSLMLLTLAGCPEKQADPTNTNDKATASAAQQSPAPKPAIQKQPSIKLTETQAAQADQSTGIIKFEKSVHDFGKVGSGKYFNCEFNFTNVGEGTLKMPRKPTAPCGCTIPRLVKMEYAPGESGVIKIRFHTPTTPGSVSKSAYVYTNDPANPKYELIVKANVRLLVSASPTLLNLSLQEENAGIKPITVKCSDGVPFAIGGFSSTNRAITADFDKSEKATEFVLTPTVDMEKLTLKPNGKINILLTHPDTKQLSLTYATPPLFKASNNRIIIFNPDPKKPEVREIMIISNYDKEVEIESISSAKKYIKVIDKEKRGKNVMLKVQVTPPEPDGKIRYFYDFLTIKIKDGNTIKITTSGTYPMQKSNAK